MTSELWQRLRAARRYADKRQQDISDACGVNMEVVESPAAAGAYLVKAAND